MEAIANTVTPPQSILDSSTYRNYVGRGCVAPEQNDLLDDRLKYMQIKATATNVFALDFRNAKREIEAVDYLLYKHYTL